jgi:hypothetical protein
MPVEYRIDQEHSLVRLEVSDPLDLEQIAETVRRLLTEPGLRAGLSLLSDHSKLEFIATTALVRSMPPLLIQLGQRLGPFRCAVVVPRDASYGMARIAEVVTEASPAEVRAFRSLEEAETWLAGLPAA